MRRVVVAGLVVVAVTSAALLQSGRSTPEQTGVAATLRTEGLVALDASGNGHHGVNQGRPTTGVPGHRGTAYSFERPQSWIQVPSHPELNPGSRDFVASAWINIPIGPSGEDTYDIIRKGLTSTESGEFKLEIYAGGAVRCSAKDSAGNEVSILGPAIDVTGGDWHQVGCARINSTWSTIVDGEIQTKRSPLGSVGNTMPLALGSKYGLEDATPGRVDEVRLVIAERPNPRARLTTRLEQLMASRPTALWHLDAKPSS